VRRWRIYLLMNLSFRGVDEARTPSRIMHRGKLTLPVQRQRQSLKWYQAIEPAIGHAKGDHWMNHCWFSGSSIDSLHAVLCSLGFNV
jgi:transposase, IS5 family